MNYNWGYWSAFIHIEISTFQCVTILLVVCLEHFFSSGSSSSSFKVSTVQSFLNRWPPIFLLCSFQILIGPCRYWHKSLICHKLKHQKRCSDILTRFDHFARVTKEQFCQNGKTFHTTIHACILSLEIQPPNYCIRNSPEDVERTVCRITWLRKHKFQIVFIQVS